MAHCTSLLYIQPDPNGSLYLSTLHTARPQWLIVHLYFTYSSAPMVHCTSLLYIQLGLNGSLYLSTLHTALPRWLIRSGCGSKLIGIRFESRAGRIFVIEIVQMQCSELSKGLECAVLSMVLCIIKTPSEPFDKSRA